MFGWYPAPICGTIFRQSDRLYFTLKGCLSLSQTQQSGILLHITSLPSRYGIGDLGVHAYRFIDFLSEAGQTIWQMLPPLHAGLGNSPYHSYSAFAGNPLLIDPDYLAFEGFVTEEELSSVPASFSEGPVQYEEVLPWKEKLLEKAAARFFVEYADITKKMQQVIDAKRADAGAIRAAADSLHIDPMRLSLFQDFERFTLREQDWVNEYALYMASSIERVNYYLFVQFIFDRQWMALKSYAHKRGIKLLGDVPFYVSPDSVEVWTHPDLFQLDESGAPSAIAGVPPDYFSAHGQLWNNPLYDWAGHSQELTDWWIRRIAHQLDYFDLLRLDHFRGFESYWSVPAGSKDARSGHWEKGPGLDFLKELGAAIAPAGQDLPLIAEDLGDITDAVRDLLSRSSLPGMKVLQFAFESEESTYLPHRFESSHCICYTGTHDNDTTRGWFEHAPEAVRHRACSYLESMLPDLAAPVDDESIAAVMIEAALASPAETVIYPMQDVLGLGSEARMNTPGTAEGNWRWRFSWDQVGPDTASWLKSLSERYKRF